MFRPSINGYSISNLKTMEGMDSLVISCNLLKDGKNVGSFFDGGDGAPYRFDGPASVEKEVSSFKQFDYESYDWKTQKTEIVKMDWDIGILVDSLMNIKDDYGQFRNLQKKSGSAALAVIDIERAGKKYTMAFDGSRRTDEDVTKQIDTEVKDKILPTFPPAYRNAGHKVKIYRNHSDFVIRF